jgi:mannosyl-3-phosphoglycerate phosphatase
MQPVVFTDLDGTMLDYDSYSYEEALPAIKKLNSRGTPLIFCTSKTRAETEDISKKTGNKHPFITENGGAVFIPKGYFAFSFDYGEEDGKYLIIMLGEKYSRLLGFFRRLKEKYDIRGFSDMSPEELSRDSGLPAEDAKKAKEREFDEAFRILDGSQREAVLKDIRSAGFSCTSSGRYCHLMRGNDKGKAVRILSELFNRKYGKIVTIGTGDEESDFPMLDNVDRGYLVMRKDGSYASDRYLKAGAAGPSGWVRVIEKEATGV